MKKASPVAEINVGPAVVQQQQVLGMDVMFIDKIPILIRVASPIELTITGHAEAVTSNKRGDAWDHIFRRIVTIEKLQDTPADERR